MGNIYIGTSRLKNVYLDMSKVKKLYLDNSMIWQSAIPVQKPSSLTVTRNYNGSAQNNGYTCPSGVNMTGTASATNGGVYTATYAPDADHIWADTEDRTPVTVTMTIQYVWQRWSCDSWYVQVTSALPAHTQWYGDYLGKYFKSNDSFTFNSQNGLYDLGNSYPREINHDTDPIMTWENYGTHPITSSGERYFGEIIGSDTYGAHFYVSTNFWELMQVGTRYTSTIQYGKGSTNYGNVESTSNVYPENGRYSDGYWYVKTW